MNRILLLLLIGLLAATHLPAQSVGINTTGASPDASAMLDVQSTTQGMLVPRMNSAQRSAISSPATGLLVYDIDTQSFWFHAASGWTELVAGNLDRLADADGNTQIQVEEGPNDNTIRFDVDGSEAMLLNPDGSLMVRGGDPFIPGFLKLYNGDSTHFLRFYGGRLTDEDPFFNWQDGTALRFATSAENYAGFAEHMRLTGQGWLGLGSSSPQAQLHLEGGQMLMRGDFVSNYNGAIPDSGSGTRLMWVPQKAAFRVGGVTSTQWDLANIGFYSSVSGGRDNIASGNESFVGGGSSNTASGLLSFVGGGTSNTAAASGYASFVGGGQSDTASGPWSFVGGGQLNYASGPWSFVGGGQMNDVEGDASFIGGGTNNLVDANFSVIGGGSDNEIIGPYGAIGGGIGNVVNASRSFVGGGESNEALGDYATVSGGQANTALGDRSFIGGGSGNEAIGDYASVGGGRNNIAHESYSFIGGGEFNDATGAESFIGNGNDNLASGFRSFVGGGAENASSGDYSSILGGYYNTAHSYGETAIGLYTETYTPVSTTAFNAADRLFVVGNGTGTGTTPRSNALTILKDGRTGIGTSSPQAKLHVQNGEVLMEGTWGIFNYTGPLSATGSGTRLMWIPGKAAFRVGRVVSDKWDLNNMGDFSAVVGGEENKASGNYTFVGGGYRNTASGVISFVGGGRDNTAIGDGSFVGGFGNVALNDGEIKLGRYSVASTSSTANPNNNTLFSLGNGADIGSRSNAFTILHDGKTVIGGSDPGSYRLKVVQTGSFGIDIENTIGNDWEIWVATANLNLWANGVTKGTFDATSGTYSATSDARLKTGITGLTPVMDKVMQLRPSQYQYRQDEQGRQYLGFIAQEVEPLFPELVRRPDPNSERESYYTLDYSGFGIIAIKALQEQQQLIEAQQAEIEALKTEVELLRSLEARLTQLEASLNN